MAVGLYRPFRPSLLASGHLFISLAVDTADKSGGSHASNDGHRPDVHLGIAGSGRASYGPPAWTPASGAVWRKAILLHGANGAAVQSCSLPAATFHFDHNNG